MFLALVSAHLGVLHAAPPKLVEPLNGATEQAETLTLRWEAAAPTNLIRNGSFEVNFAGWLSTPLWRVTTPPAGQTAVEGARYGLAQVLRPQDGTEQFLSQNIILPRQAGTPYLRWSDHTSGTIDQNGNLIQTSRWQVSLLRSNGAEIILHDRAAGENDGDWVFHEVDLSAWLGQQLTLVFSLTNRPRAICSAALDNVRLQFDPNQVEFQLYLGSSPTLTGADLVGTVTDPEWTASGLTPGVTYYWRVIQNTDGKKEFSPTFKFTVAGPPPVEAPPVRLEGTGSELQLRFPTRSGERYQLEKASSIDAVSWEAVGGEILGDGAEASVPVPVDSTRQWFRVLVNVGG